MKNYTYLIIIFIVLIDCISTSAQWVQTGLTNKNVHDLVIHDSNLFAATDDGIYHSNDNGINWTRIYTSKVVALATTGAKIYAATDYTVFSSEDNGSTWNYLNDIYGDYIYTIAAYDSNLFVGGNAVYRSTDEGATWTLVLSAPGWVLDFTYGSNNLGNKDLFVGVGYEESGAGRVYHSTDNGATWTWSTSGMNTHMVYSIAAFPDGNGSLNVFAGTWWEGVFISKDNGVSWTEINRGLTNLTINSFAAYGNNIFVGTCGDGVFLTTDNGANRTQFITGLTNTVIEAFAISETEIFVGTLGGGVLRRPISEMITEVNGRENQIISEFGLAQNYPNPFNPSTKIRYSVPNVFASESNQSQVVTLKIYDILGNQVTTLVNEEKPAGSYEVEFNAANLPSGTYFYRLKAGDFVQTNKMILIK